MQAAVLGPQDAGGGRRRDAGAERSAGQAAVRVAAQGPCRRPPRISGGRGSKTGIRVDHAATERGGDPDAGANAPAAARVHRHAVALRALARASTRRATAPAPRFVGLDNYATILDDAVFWRAAWNTFIVVNVVVYGELRLGLGLAALLSAAGALSARSSSRVVLVPYAITEVVAWCTCGASCWSPTSALISWRSMRLGLGSSTGRSTRPTRWAGRRAAGDLAAPALHLPDPLCRAAAIPHRALRGRAGGRRDAWQDFLPSPCRCSCRRCWSR